VHLPEHLFASYLLPWRLALERRDRVIVALAGLAPDVDAPILILWGGKQAFIDYHHAWTHHFFGAAMAAGVAFALGKRRAVVAACAAAAWLLHLFCDMAGAGERFPDTGEFAYPLPLLWPFSTRPFDPFPWSWPLASWQNAAFMAALLLLMGRMAVVEGRTVLEVLSVRLDRAVVTAVRGRFGGKPAPDPGAAP